MSIKFDFFERKGFKEYIKSQFPGDDIEAIVDFYVENNIDILNTKEEPVLIKGEVQSGKTNNIIYLIDALSNSYDCFIYLSGKLNSLNEQNKQRIENAVTYFSEEYFSLNMRWKSISKQKLEPVIKSGKKLIFFGIKKLEYLKNVLHSIDLAKPGARIVIFDDESDIYTLSHKSLVNRNKTSNNKNIKYISITGTPYINLLKFSNLYMHYFVYKSHPNYTGLKEFMNSNSVKTTESKDLALFNLVLKLFKSKTGTIIWNVSTKIEDHKNERKHIIKLLENEFNGWLNTDEMKNFLKINNKTINEFHKFIFKLRNYVYIDNSITKARDSKHRIIIGRETMSRGITFPNLIGEYIEYNGNKINPSIIMQAARWFGARNISKMIIYMNPKLKDAYEECLELEYATDNYVLGSSDEYAKVISDLKLSILEVN